MATRVSLFLEQRQYALETWEDDEPALKRCVDNHRISVCQGRNANFAIIDIQYEVADLALQFSLCDLRQEQSLMLESMKRSVVEDTVDDDFDYWDTIPPFGVVELNGIRLERGKATTDDEVIALFKLIRYFLLKHFLMIAFLDREIHSIRPYITDWTSNMKTFEHEGEMGYRDKPIG